MPSTTMQPELASPTFSPLVMMAAAETRSGLIGSVSLPVDMACTSATTCTTVAVVVYPWQS
jgi:hypothetical protein